VAKVKLSNGKMVEHKYSPLAWPKAKTMVAFRRCCKNLFFLVTDAAAKLAQLFAKGKFFYWQPCLGQAMLKKLAEIKIFSLMERNQP